MITKTCEGQSKKVIFYKFNYRSRAYAHIEEANLQAIKGSKSVKVVEKDNLFFQLLNYEKEKATKVPNARSRVREPEGDIATFIEEVDPNFCILPGRNIRARMICVEEIVRYEI